MKQRRFWLPLISVLLVCIGINALILFAFPTPRAEIFKLLDSSAASGRHGFIRRVYYDSAGTPHRYVVFVPYQRESNKPPPLLVFLHGCSGNGEDGVQHIHECLGPHLWETRSVFPFVVLFPQCPAGSTWNAGDVAGELTMTLMKQVQSEYKTDPDRTYLTGVSSGADGAWSLAAAYPDSFAAVLPVSGVPHGSETARNIADSQVPVWNFFVHGDGEKYETANRRIQDALLDAGASPLFTELDGTLSKTWWKHNAWGAAYHNSVTFSWLLSHSRNANAAQKGRKYQRLLTGGAIPQTNVSAGPEWSVKGSLLSNTGITPGEERESSILTCQTGMSNYELHFEFRFEQGRSFDLLFPGKEPRGCFIQIALSDFGSGGLFDLNNQDFLQQADPEAQRGLYRHIWNDVRLKISEKSVVAVVNGRELNNFRFPHPLDLNSCFSIRVQSPDTSIQWRNFRIREITE